MVRKILVTLLILSWSVSPVCAADKSQDPDGWQFLVEPYGWIPRVPLTAGPHPEIIPLISP